MHVFSSCHVLYFGGSISRRTRLHEDKEKIDNTMNATGGKIFATNYSYRLVLLLAGRVLLFRTERELDRSRAEDDLGHSFTFLKKRGRGK